jgi:hypothetical protein
MGASERGVDGTRHADTGQGEPASAIRETGWTANMTSRAKQWRFLLVLLAVAAAGVGGYWMGSHGATLRAKASSLDRDSRERVKRATAAAVGGAWIADRRAEIAALRKERDVLSEKHPDHDQIGHDLDNAHIALMSAESGVDAVDRNAMSEDGYAVQIYMFNVHRALTEARRYMDRVSK